MRFSYGALIFSLLVFQKDPRGELPLHFRPQLDKLCSGESRLQFLPTSFCWDTGLCWLVESPWGAYLAGMAMWVLWGLLQSWVASCLMQAPPSAVCLLDEEDCLFMSCSYEQPSEVRRHSWVTFEGLGKRRQKEALYSEYRRSRSSSVSKRSLPDPSSSSSSSSSSGCYLSHFKGLDFLCTSEDPVPAKCSLETITTLTCGSGSLYSGSEGESSDSALHEPSLSEDEDLCLQAEGKPAPHSALLLLGKCSNTESLSFFLQPKEVQTQTSFARLNIVQSSAYGNKDHVVLVEKSLQVQMGAVQLPKARPSLPRPIFTDAVGMRGKPTALPVLALASLQPADKTRQRDHMASLCELLGTFEKTLPASSSQRGEPSGLNAVFAGISFLDGFGPVPSVLDADTRDFLEFHIKKKMVQWKCGMPRVVAKSVDMFQPLPSLRQAKHRQIPAEIFTLASTDCTSPALLNAPRVAVGVSSSKGAPGPKETSIFSSWELKDIRQLAFHAATKMLEIKMGAFPEMVVNSFQSFCDLSEKPLPKMICSGNKILKAEYPLLPFLTEESVCILDLNIKRKCLTFAGSFSTTYTKLAAAATSRYSQPFGSEEVAQLLVSVWRQIHTVELSYLGLRQPISVPLPLDPSASSFSDEKSPDSPPKKRVTCQVLADNRRNLEEQLLVEGYGKLHPEKPLERAPSQWVLPSFFDLPERGPSQRAPPPSSDLHEQCSVHRALPTSSDPNERGPTSEKAMKCRAEGSIIRTSIFLELELKKAKLNVHLKKKMEAKLRPPQGAGLELTIEPRRKAKTSGAPRQACSSARLLGRSRRSFCYVCMPSDETGTQLKTVCWSPPKWILEMNGYRTPEVARLASKSKRSQPVQK
uniref:Uncharacterized protein n=1 Tax=Sphaerodactylus townsendi TaxID=933632 RepID=A0ACB8FK74_9SAUR